ncbi:hypothetical protein SI65_03693 [Aspergillus cristatus]|uniref:Dihydrofolate reductase n=1 Tax=Aspergillus cristatus TaxID=573508 RepID=A0A1E3BI53_ASPCR|nr:hypothetical protein SI65_03693 [Aspergillus cristatus]
MPSLSTSLTLIVATTPIPHHPPSTPTQNAQPKLGIGLKGTLPWPRIKADMSFFARVTSRPPRPNTTNAVVMGRKTYESIPEKLRPLGKRVNVVVTRDVEGNAGRVRKELEGKRERDAKRAAEAQAQGKTGGAGTEGTTDAIVSESLEAAMRDLESAYEAGEDSKLGNIYIIGGGEIYASALRSGAELNRKIRIVMTNVKRKGNEGYDCDTFFPVDDFSAESGWRTASSQEVSEWVGENVDGEWRDEGEVVIQMVGYERV